MPMAARCRPYGGPAGRKATAVRSALTAADGSAPAAVTGGRRHQEHGPVRRARRGRGNGCPLQGFRHAIKGAGRPINQSNTYFSS
ncbi:hypothetical protein GCM10010466_62380 [Planomonospora alba]|uniref:Uncharacterized protein n=1 Tax=Planomonospora alba TaxID=161354 RepID=A0ABP6NZR9_9ACTN